MTSPVRDESLIEQLLIPALLLRDEIRLSPIDAVVLSIACTARADFSRYVILGDTRLGVVEVGFASFSRAGRCRCVRNRCTALHTRLHGVGRVLRSPFGSQMRWFVTTDLPQMLSWR